MSSVKLTLPVCSTGSDKNPDPRLVQVKLILSNFLLFCFNLCFLHQEPLTKRARSQEWKTDRINKVIYVNILCSHRVFFMPMQQTAWFSIHSVRTEQEVPTCVHAHALPPTMSKQCSISSQGQKTKASILKAGDLDTEKTRSHHFINNIFQWKHLLCRGTGVYYCNGHTTLNLDPKYSCFHNNYVSTSHPRVEPVTMET